MMSAVFSISALEIAARASFFCFVPAEALVVVAPMADLCVRPSLAFVPRHGCEEVDLSQAVGVVLRHSCANHNAFHGFVLFRHGPDIRYRQTR